MNPRSRAATKIHAPEAVALEQVIAAVAGARKLRLVMLDACRDNPFEKTMQRTIALKLVNRGFSNIEPEAGFMAVYAASTADRTRRRFPEQSVRHGARARHQGTEDRGAKAVRYRPR
jgi:hypothetical protein